MPVHFEDISDSFVRTLGPRALTLEDSLRFSGEFDRLPIHLDAEAAKQSIYGSLIASGLHTLSLTASIVVDEFLSRTAMTGASGMTDVRWLAPVRPPELLTVRITVREKLPPKPGRDFGTIKMALETFNRANDKVMSATVSYLFRCRTSSSPDAAA
jgi:acyl dehydratase